MMKNIVCAPKYFKIILINLNEQRQTLLIKEDTKTGQKYCGRLINAPPYTPPKNVYALIPRYCECVTLHDKGMIKLR